MKEKTDLKLVGRRRKKNCIYFQGIIYRFNNDRLETMF